MKFKSTVAALLITLPLSAFGANLGVNSGGGGDPKDLKRFKVSADIEAQMVSLDSEAVQVKTTEYEVPESLTASQKERFRELRNVSGWFQYAAKTFRVLKSIGYPFKHPSMNTLTADRFDEVLKEITLVHGKNLKIGFFSPVTFISHPDTGLVEVDYEKFFDFVNRDENVVRGKEYKEIAVKMLTIAIHEVLVLENLEASKTYDASTEFGDAFVMMMKGDLFWRWALVKLPFFRTCPYDYEDESRREAYEYISSYLDQEIEAERSSVFHLEVLAGTEKREESISPISSRKLLWGDLFTGVIPATKAAVGEHVAKICGIR